MAREVDWFGFLVSVFVKGVFAMLIIHWVLAQVLLIWTSADRSLRPMSLAADLLGGVVLICLLVGLAARARAAFEGRDRGLVRERRAERRLVRHSVRRSADDVPLDDAPQSADSDPILHHDEGADE
ncbi:MAG: hypothetical protein IT347_01820 [Candidatus Eisenbacteria bacterium]|nr:hypothetical protein [Candidatus Eisenbacteria bacterium]